MGEAAPPRVTVLRLGHRRDRDKRITSHLGLTARAFGADEIVLSGDADPSPLETWTSVSQRFGGDFRSYHEPKPMSLLRRASSAGSIIVHLTMYGEPAEEVIPRIPMEQDVILVVGGQKVPGEVFRISDFNVSIGCQPHSEVAALAVFLNSWLGPIDEEARFSDGEFKIIPSERNKVVISRDDE